MTIFKTILISGASALAGGIAGYIFCKKQLQSTFDRELAETVNEELARIRKMHSGESSEEETPEAEKDTASVDSEDYEKAIEYIHEEFGEEGLDEYRVSLLAACLVDCQRKGLDENETDRRIQELLDREAEKEEIEDGYNDTQRPMDEWSMRPPTIVSLREYEELPTTFSFVTHHYYEDDDTLVDDGDELVDDIESLIGDALNHFGECDENDDDTVYVVNGQLGLAIEVVRVHSSYAAYCGFES